jgi:hypothetical protein
MLLNTYVIIRVVGYFINKDGRRCHVILRLCKIIGKHTSENMAGVLIDLFRDYRITGNIRYFIANNTESNNTCINVILYTLYLNILAKLRKGRRLHYFSYITNLYAQAFIIRNNIEGVYKELARAYREIDFKKVKEL